MKQCFIVFYKVIVQEFYRINAGFFLLVIGICFGFMRKQEHVALAQLFVSTIYLVIIPIGISFLYLIKVLQFNRKASRLSQNAFLSSFLLAPPALKMVLLPMIAILQLLPVWGYGLFLIVMARADQQFTSMYAVVCSLPVMTVWAAHALHGNFFYSSDENHATLLKGIFDTRFTKPHLQFFIEWIVRNQPSLFFGVKMVGCALMGGVAHLYVYDTYDERMMSLGVLFAIAANTMIVFQFHRFENYHFRILRNLPFTHGQRMMFFMITFLVIGLPEWIVLFRFFPDVLSKLRYLEFMVFGISLTLGSYALLFLQHTSFDRFVRRIFYGCMFLFLLILFRVPLPALTVIIIVAGLYGIRMKYYAFEFTAGEEI